MKLRYFFLCLLMQQACESESGLDKFYLTVKMIGADEEAQSSEGDFEPISETFQITGVELTDPDGVETELFEGEPQEFRINSSSQIIFQKEVQSEWDGVTFKKIQVTLDPEMTGVSKYSSSHSLTLSAPEISYEDSIIFSKGQSLIVLIKVKWKRTVVRDTGAKADSLTEPDFEIVLSKS